MRFDPDPVIAAYEAAYEAANGIKCPYVVTYSNGWFAFRGRLVRFNRRARDVLQMTSELSWRAAK